MSVTTATVPQDAGEEGAGAATRWRVLGVLTSYLALLEALHLIALVPAWSTSATTRARRHPKIIVTDTGLAADLIGVGTAAFDAAADGHAAGALFETLVVTEIHKQATWSETAVDLSHFRDRNGPEVDRSSRRGAPVSSPASRSSSRPRRRPRTRVTWGCCATVSVTRSRSAS